MNEAEPELRLSDYLAVLRRNLIWVVGVFAVVLGAATAITITQSPTYKARAEVLIRNTTNQSLFPGGTTLDNSILREPTAELQFTTGDKFMAAADARLTEPATVKSDLKNEAADQRVPGTSGVLLFTASSRTARGAADAANAYADTYVSMRHDDDTRENALLTSAAQSKIDKFQVELESLIAPLLDLDKQIAATQDLAVLTQLQAQRNQKDLEVSGERARVERQLADAGAEFAGLVDLQQLISDMNSAAFILDSAEPRSAPASPNVKRNIILGAIVGIILGIGAALLREELNDTITSAEQFENALGIPVLGAVPVLPRTKAGGRRRRRIVVPFESLRDSDAEAFRSIRTSIRFVAAQRPMTIIGVTSAVQAEGKTLIASKLAAAFAIEEESVLLIDGDLRRPTAHEEAGIDNTIGLSDILNGTATIDQAIRTFTRDGAHVITTGSKIGNPSELLGSERFPAMLREVSSRYQVVLIDCPPTLPVADARIIGARCDGMIIVASATQTRLTHCHRAVDLLGAAGAAPIGTVLNRAGRHSGYYYGYEYAYQSSGPADEVLAPVVEK